MLSADPRHPDPPLARLRRVVHGVRRAVLARRRLLAALLTAVAVTAGLHAASAPAPPTVAVTVAAHDLPGGVVVGPDDLTTARFAPGSVPDDLVEQPVGRLLAAPVTRGEPVSSVRLVGPSLSTSAPAGVQAMPVRLPDPAMAALLRVGDRVDLVATDPAEGGSHVVALDVTVLAVPELSAEGWGAAANGLGGRVVVLGVDGAAVPTISEAATRSLLTYAWSP